MALSSALCAACATILIQRGLQRLELLRRRLDQRGGGRDRRVVRARSSSSPSHDYTWQAVPYFVFSGVVGTAGGRLFRVLAIQKVGAPVASAVNNLAPLVASGLAILAPGRARDPAHRGGHPGHRGRHDPPLAQRPLRGLPRRAISSIRFIAASCFGTVAVVRKLGLGHAGPLFDAAINVTRGPHRLHHLRGRLGQPGLAALRPAEPALLHRRAASRRTPASSSCCSRSASATSAW